jgi:bacillithiol biosynthesis cysteine-adding enzyme BshC
MDCTSSKIPYRQTGYFNKIIVDYIDQVESLKEFYVHPPSLAGIKKAIAERKDFKYNRKALAEELKKQYSSLPAHEKVNKNIDALLFANTFTITTAHQTNIFSGPLYFIYKILHTVKLAVHCKETFPEYNFVPVFYIGSEDADLDELNHINLGGEKLIWNSKQTGAVGRMKIDKELTRLITLIEGQLAVQPHGKEIINLIKECYQAGDTIQSATFKFVHALFAEFGLIVLLPDNAVLKTEMNAIFRDDLLNQTASGIVEKSAAALSAAGYKVQANPREINLFYLKDDVRERIEKLNGEWRIVNGNQKFSEKEILTELDEHPDRFSPNVILRGIYQETILPNIAFIGGGGETAYWLQLKGLFEHCKIPFPILVLRNSFLVIEKKWQDKITKLGFESDDFFLPDQELLNKLVIRDSKNEIKLNGDLNELEQLYANFKKQATAIDTTLARHVDNLKIKSIKNLHELEKKMLRAEKRKFAAQQRQIQAIKSQLFPGNGLQERKDNISYYYAKWGKEFINILYQNSLSLEAEFVTIREK